MEKKEKKRKKATSLANSNCRTKEQTTIQLYAHVYSLMA